MVPFASIVENALNRPFECPVMKRPGKPDTGNPSVRFDEGSKSASRTNNRGWLNLLLRFRPTLLRGFGKQPESSPSYLSLEKMWVMTSPREERAGERRPFFLRNRDLNLALNRFCSSVHGERVRARRTHSTGVFLLSFSHKLPHSG